MLQTELNLSTVPRAESLGLERKYRSNGITYLELPKGVTLWRGQNPKQKTDRPLFFAFDRSFALRYSNEETLYEWKTPHSLRLMEAHYTVELKECCINNANILVKMAREKSNRLVESAVTELMLKDWPDAENIMSLDSALAQFICENTLLDGWIRLNQQKFIDEIALCRDVWDATTAKKPSKTTKIRKYVRP